MSLPLTTHPLLVGLGVWLAATALTLLVTAAIIVRLPPAYFAAGAPHGRRGSAWRLPLALARNALGVILVLAGLVLSVPGVPGQGLLTVLIGLMLVDFPGRRRMEKSLARRPTVFAAINRIRTCFGRPPLLPPSD